MREKSSRGLPEAFGSLQGRQTRGSTLRGAARAVQILAPGQHRALQRLTHRTRGSTLSVNFFGFKSRPAGEK